jgi:hypothetical protein
MAEGIETADLFRGAYLLCSGGRLGVTRFARGQVTFVIEGEKVAEEDRRYRTGQALVNPVQLRESVNLLRDLVFERLRLEKRRMVDGPHSGIRDRAAKIGSLRPAAG